MQLPNLNVAPAIHQTNAGQDYIVQDRKIFLKLSDGKRHQGLWTVISEKDYSLIDDYKWCAIQTGTSDVIYVATNIRTNGLGVRGTYTTLYLHRHLYSKKGISEGYVPDHIDRDGLNNVRGNLRILTDGDNCALGSKQRRSDIASKYRGVSRGRAKWAAPTWYVRGRVGSEYFTGKAQTEQEAAQMYDRFVMKHTAGECAPARLNFPRQYKEYLNAL